MIGLHVAAISRQRGACAFQGVDLSRDQDVLDATILTRPCIGRVAPKYRRYTESKRKPQACRESLTKENGLEGMTSRRFDSHGPRDFADSANGKAKASWVRDPAGATGPLGGTSGHVWCEERCIESVHKAQRESLHFQHDSLDEWLESDSTATARRERKEMFPDISLGCWLAKWHQGGGGGAMAGRPPGRRTRKILPIRKHGRRRDVARGMPPPAHRPPMLRRATGQRESASGGPDSRRDCKESFGLAFR
jgi:hypothetical protein